MLFLARRQRERQLEQRRAEAREHREQADMKARKAEQARLAAEEQADRARKEQAAAEQHRQLAQQIDPDIEKLKDTGFVGGSVIWVTGS